MVTKIKSSTQTFFAIEDGETFVMKAGATLNVGDGGNGIVASVQAIGDGGRTMRLAGAIVGANLGLEIDNADRDDPDRVFVAATGSIFGGEIALSGGGLALELTNEGEINALENGVLLNTEDVKLTNTGRIASFVSAVLVNSGTSDISNSGRIWSDAGNGIGVTGAGIIRNSGTIVSGSVGIRVAQSSEEDFTIVNTGRIEGDDAIQAHAGTEGTGAVRVVNRGTIVGDVNFDDSVLDDVFDMRNGELLGDLRASSGDNILNLIGDFRTTGFVAGGEGDDVYLVSNPGVLLVEKAGEGFDTLKARGDFSFSLPAEIEKLLLQGRQTASAVGNGQANHLVGNRADNALSGNAGDDRLVGAAGNDELTGGAGVDTFVFRSGDGRDIISDFDSSLFAGHDLLDLSGVKRITDFDDLIANHAIQAGADVIIDAGKGDRIVLEGTELGELSADIFIL